MNLLAVIERVEGLRQAERELRDERQLERTDRDLDHLVETRGLEDQTPELVGLVALRDRIASDKSGRRRTISSSVVPSRSASFARMLPARTVAY